MSERLVFDSWQTTLPAIGFFVFVGAFAWFVVRAWRMKASALRHLENLPLESESRISPSHVRPDPS
jgi:hypothetical protein